MLNSAIPSKKNRLIEKLKKELGSLKKFSLYRFAEDIYHTLAVMDLSNQELDTLLSQKNVLETLATEAQNSAIYDELIEGTINSFIRRY